MTRFTLKGLGGLLLAGVAGCGNTSLDHGTGSGGAPAGTSGTGSTSGSGTGGNGGTGNRGSGGGSGTGSGGAFGGDGCVPGTPVSTQIPRMKAVAYDKVLQDLLGVTTLMTSGGVQPPSAFLPPDSDGSLTDIGFSGYLAAAEQIAADVMGSANKTKFITCNPAVDSCLTDTIKSFGRKAFRRPLTDTEVTSFMRLNNLTPKGTPDEVAEAILRAFLSSPSFILLPELGSEKEGSAFKLTNYELATRLSFLLWESLPDDALNAEADAGRLSTKEQISTQARRLLTSDKAAAIAQDFHRFYLGMGTNPNWFNASHDSTKYPAFTSASVATLAAEVGSFVTEVVMNGGSFRDLFLGNAAFITKDTAALYGLDPAKFTAQPMRVELDATRRPGILTRAGFLSSFSSYAPLRRGGFISTKVLGFALPDSDPSATNLPNLTGMYTTMRQLTEALTSPPTCATCHVAYVNPPGFVLERYDAVGNWQDTDPLGGAIDGTASVKLSDTLTKTIASPLELMTEIAKLPEAQRHYAEQFVSYATGRAPNGGDACIVDQLGNNMASANYSIASLIADFTQADSFRLRSVGN